MMSYVYRFGLFGKIVDEIVSEDYLLKAIQTPDPWCGEPYYVSNLQWLSLVYRMKFADIGATGFGSYQYGKCDRANS
jgi:hypothetical protein